MRYTSERYVTGYYAYAVDERGRWLSDHGRSDLWVEGHFHPQEPGEQAQREQLERARLWADELFATDPRVARVYVRESFRAGEVSCWRPGNAVETIDRESTGIVAR
jgi:hypothetical protein